MSDIFPAARMKDTAASKCMQPANVWLVHTADTDKTRQFCLVRVGGVNKPLGLLPDPGPTCYMSLLPAT